MDRSMRWFLMSLLVLVVAGASLIVLIPGVVHGDGGVPGWVLAALGGIAVAGAVCGWRVRPDRNS